MSLLSTQFAIADLTAKRLHDHIKHQYPLMAIYTQAVYSLDYFQETDFEVDHAYDVFENLMSALLEALGFPIEEILETDIDHIETLFPKTDELRLLW